MPIYPPFSSGWVPGGQEPMLETCHSPEPWGQRTISVLSVAQSPSSGGRACGRWARGRDTTPLSSGVLPFTGSRSERPISGPAWGKKPRPSKAQECPRGLGGLVEPGLGFERVRLDHGCCAWWALWGCKGPHMQPRAGLQQRPLRASEMGRGAGEHRRAQGRRYNPHPTQEEHPSSAEECAPHQHWGARPP